MANISQQTDTFDEIRLAAPAATDQLPAMLFLAALVHGILIIGVSFSPELSNPFASTVSLEVTIVADSDQQIDRPDEAAYLAQTSQQGGGNTTDNVRPGAPLQSVMAVHNEGQDEGSALRDATAHEQSADELLSTQNTSDRQTVINPRADPQPQTSTAIAMQAGREHTLPLPQDDQANLLISDTEPRQLIISADTRESVIAAYLDNWKRRIEAVGNSYLPQLGTLDNISGSPTLMVAISGSGELTEAVIRKSSGSPTLDLAALDILQRASPFDPFPAAVSAEYDVVRFEYKWLFAESP